MSDWDPTRYLQFTHERSRPMVELLARVPGQARRVLDLGCGPGHLSVLLRERWPDAEITGVDASPAMIARARAEDRRGTYVQADLRDLPPERRADVVLSNATYQWLPDHLELLPELTEHVDDGGTFAFSVPGNQDGASHRLLAELAAHPPYAAYTADVVRSGAHGAATYLDVLARPGWHVDAWETTYLHVLPGEDPVFAWISATGARPVLDALPADLRPEFEDAYRAALRAAYPRVAYGTVLPFRRVFVVATRT
ncbi:methyltransferase domain-containing protein [Oerskovia flava]|uniref:methyltransferase domain-containing protein n=1 Tax=Oerskovia flava TaxID=2986422 RepID=UPI00223FF667|nr:methyltransferase domain-containing protein [Oerskovia sp. JB1-3-2]